MADVTIVNAIHSHDPRVPLGPLYIASFLEAHGYEVDFRDYQICHDGELGTPEQFASWLSGSAPVLAISTLSSSLPLVLSSLSRLRLHQHVGTVVLGGPGVNSVGPNILRHFDGVDIVASGEGENTLLEVMRALGESDSLESIPGISYRDGGDIRQNPPRTRIHDLDRAPFPAYHHVRLQDYTDRTDFDRIPLAVLSARGCPYACSFCDIPGLWSGGIRYRGVSNVIQEIELLKDDYGLPRFHVADDTFVYEKDRVLEFCDLLIERGLDMPWSCFGRVDRMDEEILSRLADANCDTIFYGIESGSDEILEKINKRFTAGEALDVVQQSTRFMKVHASFMWGYPFETIDDFYDTIVSLLTMHRMGAEPHLSLLVPLPSASIGKSYGRRKGGLQARDIGWDRAMMENYEYNDELNDLIARHPDIFSPFYCLDSLDFEDKVILLEDWGLGLGKPRQPRRHHGKPLEGGFFLTNEQRLPAVSEEVHLRSVGRRQFLLDTADCLLYEPNAAHAELLRSCRRGDRVGDVIAEFCRSTGRPYREVYDFVSKALNRFSERGFISARSQA